MVGVRGRQPITEGVPIGYSTGCVQEGKLGRQHTSNKGGSAACNTGLRGRLLNGYSGHGKLFGPVTEQENGQDSQDGLTGHPVNLYLTCRETSQHLQKQGLLVG